MYTATHGNCETPSVNLVDCCGEEQQMSTADHREAYYASELQLLGQAAGALDEVQVRIGLDPAFGAPRCADGCAGC
jgi:hypothetical protein